MKIVESGKYLHLYPDLAHGERIVASKFLGWKAPKGSSYIIVEDNYVNRILLGRMKPAVSSRTLQYPEGLKEYQKHDVLSMLQIGNTLNRNPMGLGKTVETIRALREANARSICIVAPKIVCPQWRDQIAVWWPERAQDVVILSGATSPVKRGSIVVTNYEKFLNENILNKCRVFSWDALVVDEAHRIKNMNSQRTKAVNSIPAKWKIALTGTPILNKPNDLWSILHFLDWRYSGISYWNFVNYFCEVHEGFWGQEIRGLTQDPNRVDTLNKLLSYVSVYNTLNVTQGKTTEVVKLPMSVKQRKLYKDMKALVLSELPENANIPNGAVLTLRVIQTTSWPGLFIPGEVGPKFEWIKNICQDNPTEKFVVFTRFEKTASGLAAYLSEQNIGAVQITGAIKDSEREDAKQRFIDDASVSVLIGTIAAMGQGTDGLQYASHTCIFIDRDWSPEIMKQCEDRVNRYGQKYPVQVYVLECEKSFDQHVGKVNQHKAQDIRAALEDKSYDI